MTGLDDAKELMLKADNHFEAAIYLNEKYNERNFPHHRYDPLQDIVNKCELAGEIYLKSYLEANGAEYAKNHRLGKILEQCIAINAEFAKLKSECDLLITYDSKLNYPNEIKISKSNIADAFKAVKTIIEFEPILELRNKCAIPMPTFEKR
jgi:HEPN domain-containing protein